MDLKIGDEAPNFDANTTVGKINFHDWLGDDWGVLMSHPADFTPVCTTEIGRVANLKEDFSKRNVKVLVLSVGTKPGLTPLESHTEWIKDVNETQGASVDFPLIEDPDKEIANSYGMIHPNASDTLTVRSVFIIGPDKKVKLVISYPASTGRNFVEILRVIDSLQLTAEYQVATPVDWKHGEDCIVVPAVPTEDIPGKFPKGHTIVKDYLRTTPQPNI
ncbi:MAG: peroxiredoxin [Chloroflexota bacterium]|jgi:alkyl hydroperoxide reductase subunit AhpC|nr:peroxiredoxin [Chloroflexota bacterium]MED5428943.1 peroxiredoxin [Chloroflexota bacterium]|tara:strand:+ start:2457 stop:3110 length:654 start_codon:yes stop_codon:yes gene_type:complete